MVLEESSAKPAVIKVAMIPGCYEDLFRRLYRCLYLAIALGVSRCQNVASV